jgi:lipoate-protein ligase A
MEWRLLRDGPGDGPWNMAVDEAVAFAVGDGQVPPTLRFYMWSAPTVSLGCLQRTRDSLDQAACQRLGIPLVRRPTGGRAVLHAAELTYSVAVPLARPWRALSVTEMFALISRGLIAGLKCLGVEASMGETGGASGIGREAGACFLARRMPAVLVDGRKVIGSAQRRWDRSLLQHGSILLDFDSYLHQAVFPAWPRSDPAANVTSLRTLLGSSPPMETLLAAMTAGWQDVFGGPCFPGDIFPAERGVAEELVRSRYACAAWTFRR